MKKLAILFSTIIVLMGVFVACNNAQENKVETENETSGAVEREENTEEVVIPRVSALNGPTAMGMVKMMADNPDDYEFNVATAIDEITANLVKGDLDIAALPANVASVLYNNTQGEIQVMAINTLGVLYIVENQEQVQSIEDLRGKTIYATGKGATPEAVLNHILEQNGLEVGTDVTVEFKAEPAECVSMLAEDSNAIAMLPQPFVTVAKTQNENLRIALDLTKEWDAVQEGQNASTLLTGVVVVRREFAEENATAVATFLEQYESSVEFVNRQVDESATLIEQFEIVKAPIAKEAIPYCNIVFIEGNQMQETLSGYLEVLFEQNPQFVGGELAGDDFYYKR